ncbi:flagellar biosynthetic protein FliO [Methylophilus sp. 14]|uniref:flagellar biosynthetic protein FliO n=1 Tax=Methylophilus sp. 14 TaxID=2781019 RepID=UPI00188E78A7|nr:flagellar biosynthetic protein FliO [Methylophilus sp. 14]MBF4988707.1 flagellar biosynthetic protein FliO [Methylophilus sp. 14]
MKTLSQWLIALFSSLLTSVAWAVVPAATVAAAPSASDSLGRMVYGTVIVLLVIAAIAWVLRRVLPGQTMAQRGVIKQVGGLQLSPRERVVVLEVAGRWLVVGINAGQMTALGEVDPPAAESTAEEGASAAEPSVPGVDPQASFAVRLQQAMQATLQQTVKSIKNKP